MRIVQMLPTISYGDAVSNDVLALNTALKKAGYKTCIYAENIDSRLSKGIVKSANEYKDDASDIVIFHLSIGSELSNRVCQFRAKVIIVYHNVTPPAFFEKYNKNTERLCKEGVECVKRMSECPVLCLADSEFNKGDLIRLGYTCPMEVLPILIAFDDYKKEPDKTVIDRYNKDDYVNIIFTGRVAPNKKQEDLITSFYYYKNYINPKSRLFIVGSYNEDDVYYSKLKKYVEMLELNDIIFTGHIPFNQILAYYHIADVFLCLSEHEGFCVPLIEAMYFDVPIIAYDSTAVGETLGESGLLLKDKNPKLVAEAINAVMVDDMLRETLIHNEKIRLQYFDNERIEKQFIECLNHYIEADV